jgi:hypothetical protein
VRSRGTRCAFLSIAVAACVPRAPMGRVPSVAPFLPRILRAMHARILTVTAGSSSVKLAMSTRRP